MAEQTSDRPLGFRICDLVQDLIGIWSVRRADTLLQRLAWPLNSHTDGWAELLESLLAIDAESELPMEERRIVRQAISLLRDGFRKADSTSSELDGKS